MNGQLVFCQKFSFPFCSPKYVMDLWSKLTPSKNGCTFYLNSLLEPELLSFLPRNISPSWHPYPLSLEHSSTSFMIAPSLCCSHHSPDTHPLVHAWAGSAGQVRVAGTVASECTGVGGGWRDPPSGKRREEKDTSGLGRREKGRRSRQRRLFSGGLHLGSLLPPNIWY